MKRGDRDPRPAGRRKIPPGLEGEEGEEEAGVGRLHYRAVAPFPVCLPIRDLSGS